MCFVVIGKSRILKAGGLESKGSWRLAFLGCWYSFKLTFTEHWPCAGHWARKDSVVWTVIWQKKKKKRLKCMCICWHNRWWKFEAHQGFPRKSALRLTQFKSRKSSSRWWHASWNRCAPFPQHASNRRASRPNALWSKLSGGTGWPGTVGKPWPGPQGLSKENTRGKDYEPAHNAESTIIAISLMMTAV